MTDFDLNNNNTSKSGVDEVQTPHSDGNKMDDCHDNNNNNNKSNNNDSDNNNNDNVRKNEGTQCPTSTDTEPNEAQSASLENSPSSVASSVSSCSSPSQMCLTPCHRFHTNPAMSSPKHFLHMHTMKASSTTTINSASSSYSYVNNSHTSESTKSLKRKQRLAQYKAQTSYSTVEHQQANIGSGTSGSTNADGATSNAQNQSNHTSAATGTGGSALSQSNHNGVKNHTSTTPLNVEVSGDACHVRWAPNFNYIKNIELVAIASPLSPIESHHHHHQQLSGQGPLHHNNNHNNRQHHYGSNNINNNNNNNNHNSLLPNTITQNHGSTVFVLVFDEGIFSHNGDFSLTSELCDLFGLPTESLVVMKDDRGGKQNISNDKDESNISTGEKKFGLRRRVFQSKTLLATPTTAPTATTTTTTGKNNVKSNIQSDAEKDAEKKQGSFQKLESTYNAVVNHIVKPLVTHVSNEVENCAQILRNEVMGDGRIYSSPIEALTMSKNKAERLTKELTSSSSCSDGKHVDKKHQQGEIESSIETKQVDHDEVNVECIEAEVGGTAECPIKPTLVFRINLPYSNTSMEVTNLEWNSDGTSLTIVQRRKGFSTSSGTSLGTSTTNKKKKANTNSSNQPVSPGNTAVSFWCIPPWLHVDYDDMKVAYDNDDEEFSEEKLIIKANNTCHDCGWEVEDDNDNRSLFPLWEWYLAKYVFKDEYLSREKRRERKTKIMMKNVMEQQAYTMELTVASNSNNSTANTRHGKKSTTRGGRGLNAATENVNSMMNGDVTCLFWENATPEDEKILGPNAYKERNGDEKDHLYFARGDDDDDDGGVGGGDDDNDNKESNDDDECSNENGKKPNYDSIITPSKWIAIGTSKGQIVLHNSAASFVSGHARKNKNKLSQNSPLLTSISPHGRTVTVPVRHKKRVTCGAWVDNLMVCGYVGTGCISLVSTFPKTQQRALNTDRSSTGISRFKQEVLEPLFGEKTAKVLGNIMLPGGRDAVHIQIGNIEDNKTGSTTILSVNCEKKCLLFYTFPQLTEDADSNSQSDITSSPAMEVNFAMSSLKGGTSCGNIIFHYMIPNTFLAVVAFSSGYFALIDWVKGTILSDKDVSAICVGKNHFDTTSVVSMDAHNDDNFLVDVAFHLPTCTAACLTNTGHVITYHVQIRDKIVLNETKDLSETTKGNYITMSSKTHKRPRTKSSSSHNDLYIDRESPAMSLTGAINLLCARRILGPKGYNIEFSSDGESLSISLGDESVTILSIKTDAKESAQIKQRLAQRIFLFTPSQMRTLFHISIFALLWLLKSKVEVILVNLR